jgi:uncharacterized protein (TIGR00730 family)
MAARDNMRYNDPMNQHDMNIDEKKDLDLIHEEFAQGFNLIKHYPKKVTFFGSARFAPSHEAYKAAHKLAFRIAKELSCAIITGGGPGIMEAANKGAFEAKGESLGLCIRLPREQHTNPYLTEMLMFNYFFVRKTIMTFASTAYIFNPGGFGTMDEFFDILTLVQTGKIPRVPLILYGSAFWKPLENYIQETLVKKLDTVSAPETKLYVITDDDDYIVDIIKNAPVRQWWNHFER